MKRKEDKLTGPLSQFQERKPTSPIQIKISKFEGSWINAEASSQSLRKPDEQALAHVGSAIPEAKNSLKVMTLVKKEKETRKEKKQEGCGCHEHMQGIKGYWRTLHAVHQEC